MNKYIDDLPVLQYVCNLCAYSYYHHIHMWIADRPSGNDMETLKLGSQGSGAPEHIGELLFSGEAR